MSSRKESEYDIIYNNKFSSKDNLFNFDDLSEGLNNKEDEHSFGRENQYGNIFDNNDKNKEDYIDEENFISIKPAPYIDSEFSVEIEGECEEKEDPKTNEDKNNSNFPQLEENKTDEIKKENLTDEIKKERRKFDLDDMRNKLLKKFLTFLWEIVNSLSKHFIKKKKYQFKRISGTLFMKKYDKKRLRYEMMSSSIRYYLCQEELTNKRYIIQKYKSHKEIIEILESKGDVFKTFFDSSLEFIYSNMFIKRIDSFIWPNNFKINMENMKTLENLLSKEKDEKYKEKFKEYADRFIKKIKKKEEDNGNIKDS